MNQVNLHPHLNKQKIQRIQREICWHSYRNPHAFQDHDLVHLMDALEDDFDNIGQHIELPQKKTIEPRVTIEYLLNVQPIKKPHPRQERVKKPKQRVLKPTPFFQEFNRFNEE